MTPFDSNFKLLKIDIIKASVLAFISLGFLFARICRNWCLSYKTYNLKIYEQLEFEDKTSFLEKFNDRTNIIIQLTKVCEVIIPISVGLFLGVLLWKEVLGRNNFLRLSSDYFMYFLKLTYGLIVILWLLILLQLQKIRLKEQTIEGRGIDKYHLLKESAWILRGKGKRVYGVMILTFFLIPFPIALAILPPVLFSAINNYLYMEKDIHLKTYPLVENKELSIHNDPNDKLSTGLDLICFFIPPIGAIIFLINMDFKPKKAKEAGKAALWGLVFGLTIQFFYVLAVLSSSR